MARLVMVERSLKNIISLTKRKRNWSRNMKVFLMKQNQKKNKKKRSKK